MVGDGGETGWLVSPSALGPFEGLMVSPFPDGVIDGAEVPLGDADGFMDGDIDGDPDGEVGALVGAHVLLSYVAVDVGSVKVCVAVSPPVGSVKVAVGRVYVSVDVAAVVGNVNVSVAVGNVAVKVSVAVVAAALPAHANSTSTRDIIAMRGTNAR